MHLKNVNLKKLQQKKVYVKGIKN